MTRIALLEWPAGRIAGEPPLVAPGAGALARTDHAPRFFLVVTPQRGGQPPAGRPVCFGPFESLAAVRLLRLSGLHLGIFRGIADSQVRREVG